jgi:hypothetical protein
MGVFTVGEAMVPLYTARTISLEAVLRYATPAPDCMESTEG